MKKTIYINKFGIPITRIDSDMLPEQLEDNCDPKILGELKSFFETIPDGTYGVTVSSYKTQKGFTRE